MRGSKRPCPFERTSTDLARNGTLTPNSAISDLIVLESCRNGCSRRGHHVGTHWHTDTCLPAPHQKAAKHLDWRSQALRYLQLKHQQIIVRKLPVCPNQELVGASWRLPPLRPPAYLLRVPATNPLMFAGRQPASRGWRFFVVHTGNSSISKSYGLNTDRIGPRLSLGSLLQGAPFLRLPPLPTAVLCKLNGLGWWYTCKIPKSGGMCPLLSEGVGGQRRRQNPRELILNVRVQHITHWLCTNPHRMKIETG